MEGVVAGVPSLADYDVIIDAGADKSDPENAVPFSLETKAGKKFEQPGNFFALVETSVFGTEPKFVAKGVKPDLDGDGKVTFPEALPDADFLLAAATDFVKYAKELDESAKKWDPTLEDAFTAVVVMTPTMSEYFEAWKNSRFIAGDKAEEKGFVATSRLSDIRDILGGLVLIYDSIQPSVEKVDAAAGRRRPRSDLAEAARVRRAPADRGAGRQEVHRLRRRHARLRGPAQRRGDRRPGLAGRRAARTSSWRTDRVRGRARLARGGRRRCWSSRPPPRRPSDAVAGRRAASPTGSSTRRPSSSSPARTRPSRTPPARARAYQRRSARGAAQGRSRPPTPRSTAGAARRRRAPPRAGDQAALAAARGSVRAGLFRGAYSVTVEAAGRGDAATAKRWLLLREYRTATRFTRPGAQRDARARPARAAASSPPTRRHARPSTKDLLDAYQARLRELLADARRGIEQNFPARRAEAAAQAAGYFAILAPRYAEDRGAAGRGAGRRPPSPRCPSRRRARPALDRADAALEGFTAAPFTPEEAARRAQQLLQFLALVPVEYGRGVKGTQVTRDFEIQEAVAFRTGAVGALRRPARPARQARQGRAPRPARRR